MPWALAEPWRQGVGRKAFDGRLNAVPKTSKARVTTGEPVSIVSILAGIRHQPLGMRRKYRFDDRTPAKVGYQSHPGILQPVYKPLVPRCLQDISADCDDHLRG